MSHLNEIVSTSVTILSKARGLSLEIADNFFSERLYVDIIFVRKAVTIFDDKFDYQIHGERISQYFEL